MLDDDACPAELQACYPRGGSRFSIQMRRGGLVRVHDSILMANVITVTCCARNRLSDLVYFAQSQYKSLLISERTTIDDLIELLLRCHGNNERIERFSIYEVNTRSVILRKQVSVSNARPLHECRSATFPVTSTSVNCTQMICHSTCRRRGRAVAITSATAPPVRRLPMPPLARRRASRSC